MTADELRELADVIEPMGQAPRFSCVNVPAACAYLRACADAQDAGPVAWSYKAWHGDAEPSLSVRDPADFRDPMISECTPLYPLAMPAQAQPLRLPEPMTGEEVDALIDETEYLTTDRAVRYLVKTGERRVKEANE